MTWPTTNVPATAPTTHGPVRTQAYQAGGGDYFRSGYYSNGGYFSTMTNVNAVLGRMYVRPFVVPVRRGFDRLAGYVTTASAAASGGVLRFGIYGPGAGLPGTLIVDAGTVSTETVGAKEVTISQTLDPGVYWLACAPQVVTCSIRCIDNLWGTPFSSQSATWSNFPEADGAFMSSVTGALPGTFVRGGGAYQPWLGLRAA